MKKISLASILILTMAFVAVSTEGRHTEFSIPGKKFYERKSNFFEIEHLFLGVAGWSFFSKY